MTKLVQHLPNFGVYRDGSFRFWIKTITINEVNYFWRQTIRRRKHAGEMASIFWDGLKVIRRMNRAISGTSEYTDHVLRRLQELIEPEFSPTTWRAFCLRVHEEKRTDEVAGILGISPNAVDVAKSRCSSPFCARSGGSNRTLTKVC